MSSERRRLSWWQWLLLGRAVIAILTIVAAYTLQPAVLWAAG